MESKDKYLCDRPDGDDAEQAIAEAVCLASRREADDEEDDRGFSEVDGEDIENVGCVVGFGVGRE